MKLWDQIINLNSVSVRHKDGGKVLIKGIEGPVSLGTRLELQFGLPAIGESRFSLMALMQWPLIIEIIINKRRAFND